MNDIHVDKDVFGPMNPADPFSSSDEGLAVVTTSREEAIEALARTTQRWMLIRLDGYEYATFAEMLDSTSTLETPSWVSGVTESGEELVLVFDASGNVPPAMAQRLLDALTTELVRAGVQQARVKRPARDYAAGVVVAEARPPA